MRKLWLLPLVLSVPLIVMACDSTDSGGSDGGSDGQADAQADGARSDDGAAADGSARDGAGTDLDASDGSSDDGSTPTDGGPEAGPDAGPDAGDDGGGNPGQPSVSFLGRFDTTNANPVVAWPGARIAARFTGSGAQVTLSHENGLEGGNSWFNVTVDGQPGTPFEVTGVDQVKVLASGLGGGTHVVEIEKRTEANLGRVTFKGFQFTGGALQAPAARPDRRIEFLSDSTIDGFGVDGQGPADPNTCNGGAPPVYNDSGKSVARLTANALSADHHLVAYSGKGIVKNEDVNDGTTFPMLYGRTLPESPGSAWNFASWVPDVVVVSLGGTDVAGTSAVPGNFTSTYTQFVATIRSHYPNAHIFVTVWSQIKDLGGAQNSRTAVRNALDAVVTARANAGDNKVYRFQFPEAAPAVETGCYFHANAAHHQAMSALLVTEIKNKVPAWN